MHAALDWSGAADRPVNNKIVELYLPCLVSVQDEVMVNVFFDELRRQNGLPLDYEFHGYMLRKRPSILLSIVEFALANASIVAFIFDKRVLITECGIGIFDKPARFAPATGLLVVHHALEAGDLRTLTYDKPDIDGDRRKEFSTSVKRKVRGMGRTSIGIKPDDSDKSAPIQFADVVAYVLQREEHGLSETQELRRSVRRLMQRSKNCISRGSWNDLQPYLPL